MGVLRGREEREGEKKGGKNEGKNLNQSKD